MFVVIWLKDILALKTKKGKGITQVFLMYSLVKWKVNWNVAKPLEKEAK